PASRDQALPLAAAQERLWFLDQLAPGLSSYSIYDASEVTGPLDIAVLRRTMTEMVRRHESLRTTFQPVGGVPIQVIAPPGIFHLPFIDLASLPEAECENEGRRLTLEEAAQPFDLVRGPL